MQALPMDFRLTVFISILKIMDYNYTSRHAGIAQDHGTQARQREYEKRCAEALRQHLAENRPTTEQYYKDVARIAAEVNEMFRD